MKQKIYFVDGPFAGSEVLVKTPIGSTYWMYREVGQVKQQYFRIGNTYNYSINELK